MAASASLCMAAVLKDAVFLLLVLVGAVHGPVGAAAHGFDVGGEHGWAVPPSNNTRLYNRWASKNRFRVGDSLVFRYEKDSVMMVTEEEYDHCNSRQPIVFSNSGDTEVELDHAGVYYFVSGLREHCEKGQKMIVWVLAHPGDRGTSAPPSPPDGGRTDGAADRPAGESGAFRSCRPSSSVLLMAGAAFSSSLFFCFLS